MNRRDLSYLTGVIWGGLGFAHDHMTLGLLGAGFLLIALYWNHREKIKSKPDPES